MNRTILTVGGVLSASSLLLVDSAVKGTVLLALAAVAALILRRDSAATRHLVWLLAIVAMLVVPVLSAMLPQWRVLPAWMSSPRPAVAEVGSPAIVRPADVAVELPQASAVVKVERPSETVLQPTTVPPVSTPAVVTPAVAPAMAASSWSWVNALPLVWVAGFAVLMLRLSAARWVLWNSERLATVVCRRVAPQLAAESRSDSATTQDPIVIAMKAICSQLGISRPVTLLIHPDKTIPVVWGIFRCRLMLPAAARQWSDEQLQSVLLHELAHIKRRDTRVQLLAQVACALHWFNPLVWFAAWRLDVERERACDDLVLASGIRPSAYAGHLLDVVTGLSPARWTQACGLAMARKSSLEGRLTAVLGKDLNRRGVSVALGGIALAIAVGVAVPIAMLCAAVPVKPNGDALDENAEPKDDESNALFEMWKSSARSDGKIPGGRIGEMAASLKTIIDLNPGTEAAAKCEAVLKKCDATRDWDPAEAAALLDEITVVIPSRAGSDVRANRERRIHPGKPIPDELKNAPWGQPAANDLRTAWLLEPIADTHSLGSVLKSRVLFHNTGRATVCFATDDWVFGDGHEATDSNGEQIDVWTAGGLGISARKIVRLAPGEYAEAEGAPVGVGSHETSAEASSDKVGCWIEAKEGDTVTFTPRKLRLTFLRSWRNNKGPQNSDSALQEIIAARVMQESPMPAAATDREQLLRRVMQDLTGAAPTAKEIATFVADNTPDALAKLTKSLQTRVGAMHFAGELAGGETKFRVTAAAANEKPKQGAAAAPAPKHKDARALYEVWQRYARANGDIPGALVGELAAAVKTFIKYNPTWETVPKLNAILPRLDATHDWKSADSIALLDEVAGVQDSPLKAAAEKATRSTIRKGEALPKKFADAPWGDAQPNGLRAAWVLEPSAAEHRIGAALKARLLVWNPGAVSVSLQMPTFHQGGVKARDAKDVEVQVSGISWTTRALLVPVRLAPGEYIEIRTPGVGIGPRAGMGPWAGPRVGSNVLAKAGEELTLTHGLVPLDGSEVGVSQDDPHVSGPGYWLAHIKARLNRELPLPAAAAERTRMLDRAVRDLFATAPTAEETAEFIADKTPDALDALAKRLAARVDVVSFSGKLPTAPVKFRVLAADANADKQPRVVLGPGEYPLSGGTATSGAVTLKIVGRPVGDHRTNDGGLLFEATEATGKLPLDPHKLEIPDGWGAWAIVCRPDSGVFYLLSKGAVRKIDYSAPRKVTDTPANDLPVEFRDEVKRILDIHEISAAKQAEVFEKPAAPAALEPKTGEAGKPKLPDEAYTRTGVHCQKFGKEAAKRPGFERMLTVSEAQAGDGPLMLNLRVARDANWNIGGTVRVELVVRNQSRSDVKFAQTLRTDNGLSVVVIAKDGKEYVADIAQFDGLLVMNHLLLPPSYMVMVKSFTLHFDAEKRGVSEPEVATLHLPPGDYTLRCKWDDARPAVSHEGEWTGEATSVDYDFKLATAAPPQTSETPKTTEQEAFTAWGKEVGGLQAGLGFKAGEKRLYRHGETATLVVRVRNVGQNDIKFKYYPTFLSENSPTVADETGKRVSLRGNFLGIVKRDIPKEVNLAVGKEIELYERELRLASGNEDAGELKTRDIFPTGKFLIQHEQVIGNSAQASDKLDPALEKLATGKLEFEVREAFTAWGKEVGGLQAGLGFKANEKRAYTHGDWATLVVRVRNVGKEEVKFQYLRQFFVEQPPTVFNEKGELKQLGRTDAFGEHIPVEVKLAAGKEIELYELKVYLGTGSEEGKPKYPYIFGTGKFQVQYEKVFGNSSSGSIKLDPALSKLATGKLELEVKEAQAGKQKVLTPEDAVKIAGDSKLTKEFNEKKPAVEFKVEFVTKAIQVKVSGEKDARWVLGHSPEDVCLGVIVPASTVTYETRFVATLTEKAIKQFNKAGITNLEEHFNRKTIRVAGPIYRNDYWGDTKPPFEVVIVLDDISQLELVK